MFTTTYGLEAGPLSQWLYAAMRQELPHAVLAVLVFPLRLQNAHRDYGINSPTPRGIVLDSNRADLDLVVVTLEDDVVVVVGLRVDDPAAEKDKELAVALRELAEVRLELARRDPAEAFANAPSPSASLH
jgi:hypothetical protein